MARERSVSPACEAWERKQGHSLQDALVERLADLDESLPTHGLVYKISSPSGKAYIGQSYRARRHRKNEHKCAASGCYGIKHAIAKYGWEAMHWEVLVDNVPIQDLDAVEDAMVDQHQTRKPKGYNIIRPARPKTSSQDQGPSGGVQGRNG